LIHVKLMMRESGSQDFISSKVRCGAQFIGDSCNLCDELVFDGYTVIDFLKSHVHLFSLDEIFSPLKSLYPYFM